MFSAEVGVYLFEFLSQGTATSFQLHNYFLNTYGVTMSDINVVPCKSRSPEK